MKFETLLGKSFAFAASCIGEEFINEPFQNGTYFLEKDSSYKSFYDSKYNCLSIYKDDREVVHSITVHLLEVLNFKSFNLMVAQYGAPDHIWVATNTSMISETIEDSNPEFKQRLTKSEQDLREGTFEEKPLVIIWNKKDFEIKVLFRYEQNQSKITYRSLE